MYVHIACLINFIAINIQLFKEHFKNVPDLFGIVWARFNLLFPISRICIKLLNGFNIGLCKFLIMLYHCMNCCWIYTLIVPFTVVVENKTSMSVGANSKSTSKTPFRQPHLAFNRPKAHSIAILADDNLNP